MPAKVHEAHAFTVHVGWIAVLQMPSLQVAVTCAGQLLPQATELTGYPVSVCPEGTLLMPKGQGAAINGKRLLRIKVITVSRLQPIGAPIKPQIASDIVISSAECETPAREYAPDENNTNDRASTAKSIFLFFAKLNASLKYKPLQDI